MSLFLLHKKPSEFSPWICISSTTVKREKYRDIISHLRSRYAALQLVPIIPERKYNGQKRTRTFNRSCPRVQKKKPFTHTLSSLSLSVYLSLTSTKNGGLTRWILKTLTKNPFGIGFFWLLIKGFSLIIWFIFRVENMSLTQLSASISSSSSAFLGQQSTNSR